MVFPWFRTFSITKEVGRKYVRLSIPFATLDAQHLKVQDWNICPQGNALIITLRKEPPEPQELQEKLENYQRYSIYPGEANKTKD